MIRLSGNQHQSSFMKGKPLLIKNSFPYTIAYSALKTINGWLMDKNLCDGDSSDSVFRVFTELFHVLLSGLTDANFA